MRRYKHSRRVWDFHADLCREPGMWIATALTLRRSFNVLRRYDREMFDCIFDKKVPLPVPAFFSANVERMLMGFSIENLVKAVLLLDTRKADRVFAKEGKLRWDRGHDLVRLFREASIAIDSDQQLYLRAWSTCSTWAGRYPIPTNENGLPREEVGGTREELTRRFDAEMEKALQQGKLPEMELFAMLHGSVGDGEFGSYCRLFDRLQAIAEGTSLDGQ